MRPTSPGGAPTGTGLAGACRWLGLAVLLAAAALTALSGPAHALEVGHRQVEFADAARGGRAVLCEVYYPADEAGDAVAVAAGEFPVVGFGHGYLLPWSAYEWLWNALVPAGYVVALPRTEGGLFPSHGAFGADLAFVVAALRAAGQDPASPFFGHVGPTAAVMGHSMGGGASVLAAAADPSITAVANLAAAETNPSAVGAAGAVTAPALVFAGSHDCVAPPAGHQLPIYGALGSGCKTYVSVTGGSHCQFAGENSICSLGEGGCTPPSVTRAAQLETVARHLLPWLAFVLKGDAAAWGAFQTGRAGDPAITSSQYCVTVGVAPEKTGGLSLRVRPNPARGAARVSFRSPEPGRARLDVFDVAGRRVAVLTDVRAGAEERTVDWDGLASDGRRVPAGAYRIRLDAGDRTESRTLVLLH